MQFKQAHETDELVNSTRAAVATLLGGEPSGVTFGPSFTALTMRFAATVVRGLEPGDEIVCTRLDHDSNVRPWVIAAERAGVTVRFAEPTEAGLELPASAVEAVLSERTKWIAVTAASNAIGSVPDLRGDRRRRGRGRRARVCRRRPRHAAPPHSTSPSSAPT